jgi:outer membrane protein TolC
MRQHRSLMACLALLLAGVSGCRTLEVKRLEEAERFRRLVRDRAAAVKIEPASPLSMDRCVEIALANNLDQAVRELELSLQDEKVRLAMAGWLPKASANYTSTRRSNPALTEFGGGLMPPGTPPVEMQDQSLRAFSFSSIIPVLDWGATYYAYQKAKDKRRQERLTLERSRQTLTRDVRVAYARLAGRLRQERLSRVGLLAARELLRMAQSLEREGQGTRAETASVEAGLAQAASQWTAIRRGVERARLTLAQTMSLPAGVPFTISETPPPPRPLPKPEQIAALEEHAVEARPELQVQDRERRIAASDARKEFAQFFPRLDGLANFNWSSLSTAVNPAYFTGGFQVASSLLDGGTQWWDYRLARKTMSVEEMRAMLLTLGILYEVDLQVLEVFTAFDGMVTRGAVVQAQQEALKQMVSLYREGLETGTNTVRSLAEMYNARLLLDQEQTNYQMAWYELDAATLAQEPKAAAPPGPPPPAFTPLPPFTPSTALDSPQAILDSVPPLDLHQFPELEGLLNAEPPPGKRP